MVASWAVAIARTIEAEPDPDPVAVIGAVCAEALEGLEEPLDLVLGDGRTGVGDGEHGPARSGRGRDVDVAVRLVVAERVVEQVGDELLD
jgi:hypothetical protein